MRLKLANGNVWYAPSLTLRVLMDSMKKGKGTTTSLVVPPHRRFRVFIESMETTRV